MIQTILWSIIFLLLIVCLGLMCLASSKISTYIDDTEKLNKKKGDKKDAGNN